jgi:two-component system, NtrC family, nitrogen regulation sensor histidine kinase NtrY
MLKKRPILIFFLLATLFLLLAVVAESLYFSDYEYVYRTRRFNKILHEKEKIMDDCLAGLEQIVATSNHHGSFSENRLFSIAKKNKITILEYLDNKLLYWSDNDFDVPVVLDDSVFMKPIIFIQNGWFVPRVMKASNEVVVGLLRVRTDHSFENDIIRNGFEKDFRMPARTGFSQNNDDSPYRVFNSQGTFLFSLSFPSLKSTTALIVFPLTLWVLTFIFIILLSHKLFRALYQGGKGNSGIILCFLIYSLLYLVLLFSGKPAVFVNSKLFSAYVFSLNGFIPSLGHLMFLSILAADLSFLLFRTIPFRSPGISRKGAMTIILLLLLVLAAALIFFLHILFGRLIRDSNINFEAYKVLKISLYSIAGYTAMILLYIVPLLCIIRSVQIGRLLMAQSGDQSNEGWVRNDYFSLMVIFSLVFGFYSLAMIIINSDRKTTENIKIQALSLSTENDPEAEHMLLDSWPVMEEDSVLKKLMKGELFQDNYASIATYLHETYFNGYWSNYNFYINLCRSDDPMQIVQTGEMIANCFDFFNERVKKYGHRLTGTGFWFIDNQGGRSYYMGELLFDQPGRLTNGLFIELYNDINAFQPGYSELLLDKKFQGYSGLKDYSFAKYVNGEIVLKSGDFAYNKSDVEYVDKNSDYRIFKEGKFKHLLYKNGNATVIISQPEVLAGDILITFAYLFTYTFLFMGLLLLIVRRPIFRNIGSLNFRQKLQLMFTGILLFSFILVGIMISYLTIKEYKAKHYEIITEKLNSIYLELDSKLAGEQVLSHDWRDQTDPSLNEMLIRLSNIFNTDINIYNIQGFLEATSREEIYSRDLTGLRINNVAKNNLEVLTKSLYSQTETIGRMKYISVYVPFYNIDNKLLAYLNLPYFRMQSQLAREISNLVVSVINFTLLLVVITMSLAVFISGRLTSPLTMLNEGLASVELGKKSKHLEYKGSDEIGELVKQYNRMVDELDESAGKLADSEREYAWREMAKQIAHEIKNPLTPMKLNVQQLLKSWKDRIPDFNEKIEGFSRNQIEYIDNLSSIASAFSSFAKMPGANPLEVDLLEQVRSTLELFKNTDNVTFEVNWPHESKIFIYADRDHLNGIFSNLFKNSIQAIPQDREGFVNVSTEVIRNKVVISVTDNGSGIPEELKKKMFTPNFTTKSSGTGLGLSIVKKYVEGAGGRVWFESEAGKGTSFHIEFPLTYTVEKPGSTYNG